MTPTLSELTILLVDDEGFMRSLVARLINGLGVKSSNIIEAKDGNMAKQRLLSGGPKIDLVLLDLEMPVMGGIELLTLIRVSDKMPNNQVPVIVLTGHTDRRNLVAAANIGIHGFLAKPVSRALLERQLNFAIKSSMIDPSIINHDSPS